MLRETQQDLVVRSSKGKIGDQFVKPKIWKSNENWVGDKKQSACGWCGF